MQAVIPSGSNDLQTELAEIAAVNAELHAAIAERVAACPVILASRAYGSSLYRENTVDFDTAVLVPSEHGVVAAGTYIRLKRLRDRLTYELKIDLDLVPHTADEFDDPASPLWNPRYNPSLLFGRDIKGHFPAPDFVEDFEPLDAADMARMVLHDNRTITRRQLIRTLEGERGRIYVSKLLHGPGNALLVRACRLRVPCEVPPSDLRGSIREFDRAYGCNSKPVHDFLECCRKSLNYYRALRLMEWHEHLFSIVRKRTDEAVRSYDYCCQSLALTG